MRLSTGATVPGGSEWVPLVWGGQRTLPTGQAGFMPRSGVVLRGTGWPGRADDFAASTGSTWSAPFEELTQPVRSEEVNTFVRPGII